MSTKLTLSIDETVIEKAKVYARSRSKSLSKVIEQYLQFVTENQTPPTEVTDTVRLIADTLSPSVSDDDLKYQYLKQKYLDA
jgi:uncharacterized phage infection (PIP) family protein YhgE